MGQCLWGSCFFFVFFFNDTATTEIYTLSLHDALPTWPRLAGFSTHAPTAHPCSGAGSRPSSANSARSEEHTSELQSHVNLVCRLLLEKKKKKKKILYCIKKKKKTK